MTVADFDRLIVMSEGRVVELGTPKGLLSREGVFWGMVAESADKDEIERVVAAAG